MIFFVPLDRLYDSDGDLLPLTRIRLEATLYGMLGALNECLSGGPEHWDALAGYVEITEELMRDTQAIVDGLPGWLKGCDEDLKRASGEKGAEMTEEDKETHAVILRYREYTAWDTKHSERSLPMLQEHLNLFRRAEAITRGDRS